MIPRTINYCWFGGKKLPSEVKKSIESWRIHCPGYEIKQWNESNFDISHNPFAKSAYNSRAWAFVSDYVRLKVIYDNGGIYLDTDVELLKNLDDLLFNDFYIGVQQYERLCTTGLGFGATKGNLILKMMLEKYEKILYTEQDKNKLACPNLNNSVLKSLGYTYADRPVLIKQYNALILPPKYMDPLAPGKTQKNLLCEESISIHHYGASWLGNKVLLRRKLIRFLGEEKLMRIKRFTNHG